MKIKKIRSRVTSAAMNLERRKSRFSVLEKHLILMQHDLMLVALLVCSLCKGNSTVNSRLSGLMVEEGYG
jgi:hypothetical protein